MKHEHLLFLFVLVRLGVLATGAYITSMHIVNTPRDIQDILLKGGGGEQGWKASEPRKQHDPHCSSGS